MNVYLIFKVALHKHCVLEVGVLSQLVCCVPCSPVSPSVSCCCSLCADARDSIAKVAYGRVFGWIVCKINELLAENVDPEVELREIGEFCLPFSCSVLRCASLSHKEGHSVRFHRACVLGCIIKAVILLEIRVSSMKSVGPCSTLSSQLI